MTGHPGFDLVLLPILLGVFGFIEPCSLGSTLLFIKAVEGRGAAAKLNQTTIFALTRALFIGGLGAMATLAGYPFLGFQRAAWVLLGLFYVAIGAAYVFDRSAWLMRSIGPRWSQLSGAAGPVTLGLLFGLNIPACAAPLLAALLGAAAAGAAVSHRVSAGFVSLGLFGLALSLPLVIAVLFEPARHMLDWLAGLSRRLPFWTGLLLAALGVWSVWFGLFASINPEP